VPQFWEYMSTFNDINSAFNDYPFAKKHFPTRQFNGHLTNSVTDSSSSIKTRGFTILKQSSYLNIHLGKSHQLTYFDGLRAVWYGIQSVGKGCTTNWITLIVLFDSIPLQNGQATTRLSWHCISEQESSLKLIKDQQIWQPLQIK
jgi:hypothetical protein